MSASERLSTANHKFPRFVKRVLAWRDKFWEFSKKHWLLYLALVVASTLIAGRIEDSVNRQIDQIIDPTLREAARFGSDLVISPLLLPALLFCVLLVASFAQTMKVSELESSGDAAASTARKPKRRMMERGVLWETDDTMANGNLTVRGPYCPEPCLSLLGTLRGDGHLPNDKNTNSRGAQIGRAEYSQFSMKLWCPSCDKTHEMGVDWSAHYYAENVDVVRDQVRAKFEAEIRRELEDASD